MYFYCSRPKRCDSNAQIALISSLSDLGSTLPIPAKRYDGKLSFAVRSDSLLITHGTQILFTSWCTPELLRYVFRVF